MICDICGKNEKIKSLLRYGVKIFGKNREFYICQDCDPKVLSGEIKLKDYIKKEVKRY